MPLLHILSLIYEGVTKKEQNQMKFPAYSTEPKMPVVVTRKRQRCRLKKLVCPSCGVIVRTAQVNIDSGKIPLCACDTRFVVPTASSETTT